MSYGRLKWKLMGILAEYVHRLIYDEPTVSISQTFVVLDLRVSGRGLVGIGGNTV